MSALPATEVRIPFRWCCCSGQSYCLVRRCKVPKEPRRWPVCGVERTRAVALIDPLSGAKQQAGLARGTLTPATITK
jgi:hypothetical protein